MAQVWVRTHSITSMLHADCVIVVSDCSLFDDSIFLFPHHLLYYHPVFPSARQLHLPGCGGEISRCTSANEDLGKFAEYDPLAIYILNFHCNYVG